MKSYPDCLPCLARNVLDIAKLLCREDTEQLAVLRGGLACLAACDMRMPPPFHLREVWELAQKTARCQNPDPYADKKAASTSLALELASNLGKLPGYNPASFEHRLRLATSGNVLDFGIYSDLRADTALKVMEEAFQREIDLEAVAQLERKVLSAKSILYILDNCGEAVFDRVFMEPYQDKVTYGVRGGFTLNDITRAELEASGMGECRVIDSGCNIPGTILEYCSADFQAAFHSADLIIAKGQGNFETLDGTDRPIAFLFMAKCPIVCGLLGVEQNTVQLKLMNF